MSKIRTAVIGVGYLGRFHAQKYQQLENSELRAVCDINPKVADKVANELGVDAIYDFISLLGRVDAVSIAATTNQHFEIAKTCLKQGLHVLIEKPIVLNNFLFVIYFVNTSFISGHEWQIVF